MSVIKVENISLTYGKGTSFCKTALDDVSFEIEQGEFLGIIGHTGSGKSTLVQLLNGLLRPDKGRILLSGGKDETVEAHGLIKCKKNEYKDIDPADIISARLTDFGADVMISDRKKAAKKYSGLVIDDTTLEEIMLFYVRRDKKEWI